MRTRLALAAFVALLSPSCADDETSCTDLDEEACEQNGCHGVTGAACTDADCLTKDADQLGYVGCTSQEAAGSYLTCAIAPDGSCYWFSTGLIPEGWTELFECSGAAEACK